MTTCEWLIEQQKSGALRELHPGALGLSGLVLLVLLLVASYTDLRWRLIRNHTTYPAILIGLLLNGVLSSLEVFGSSSDECVPLMLGGIGISQSLLGGLLCFGGMSIQFLMFGTGAGDVKLMAALGVLLGWRTGLEVWLCTMLLAASFAVLLLLFRVGCRSSLALLFRNAGAAGTQLAVAMGDSGEKARAELKKRLPLAPFFAISCVVVLSFPLLNQGKTLAEWGLGLL